MKRNSSQFHFIGIQRRLYSSLFILTDLRRIKNRENSFAHERKIMIHFTFILIFLIIQCFNNLPIHNFKFFV